MDAVALAVGSIKVAYTGVPEQCGNTVAYTVVDADALAWPSSEATRWHTLLRTQMRWCW